MSKNSWTICLKCKLIQTVDNGKCFFCKKRITGPRGTLKEINKKWRELEYGKDKR